MLQILFDIDYVYTHFLYYNFYGQRGDKIIMYTGTFRAGSLIISIFVSVLINECLLSYDLPKVMIPYDTTSYTQ